MISDHSILQSTGVRSEGCNLPLSQGARLNESVAARLEALLARCDRIRRGSDCPRPVRFDRRGQRHAEQVAKQEADRNG